MNLILEIESLADEAADRYAAGVVVLNGQTCQPIHEMGYMLGSLATPHAADYLAMIKAMDLALPLKPYEVEIRCGSQSLVNQITDADPISDNALIPYYEQAVQALLQFDTWKIRAADRKTNRPAVELAQRALDSGSDITQPPRHRADAAAAQPAGAGTDASTAAAEPGGGRAAPPLTHRPWTVELLDEPGIDCPARCHAGLPYTFGPDTPGGFCVHAARAALNDGPLTWDDPDQKQVTTLCPECQVPLRIAVVE